MGCRFASVVLGQSNERLGARHVGFEVDFLARLADREELIQVCSDLSAPGARAIAAYDRLLSEDHERR